MVKQNTEQNSCIMKHTNIPLGYKVIREIPARVSLFYLKPTRNPNPTRTGRKLII